MFRPLPYRTRYTYLHLCIHRPWWIVAAAATAVQSQKYRNSLFVLVRPSVCCMCELARRNRSPLDLYVAEYKFRLCFLSILFPMYK